MQERSKIFIWCLPFVCLVACKKSGHNHKHDHAHHQRGISTETPAGFDAFYNKFHQDSLYQMNHILFPLKVKDDQSLWQAEDWEIHHNPLQDTVNVRRKINSMSGLVIEVIYHVQGFFLIERRFMPTGEGEWQMIYYTQLNNLTDWERVYEESGLEIKTDF